MPDSVWPALVPTSASVVSSSYVSYGSLISAVSYGSLISAVSYVSLILAVSYVSLIFFCKL